VGLVPSEYSTGDKTRRFGITKTGNAHVRSRAGTGGLALPAPAARRLVGTKEAGWTTS